MQWTIGVLSLHVNWQVEGCARVSSTSFKLLGCLHKCMKNIPYRTAFTIVFLMMNIRCLKHVEDEKNLIKTLI
jgi:hypothetical protein